LTVANVRDAGSGDVVVTFLESARFYRLSRTHPRFGELLTALRTSLADARTVRVLLAGPTSDVIEDVQPP
jgi:hypothetical protein